MPAGSLPAEVRAGLALARSLPSRKGHFRLRVLSLLAFRALTCLANAGYLSGSVIPQTVELKDIKAIIDLMRKNDLSVFEMEKDGFRLKLQKGISEQPISMIPAPSASVVQNGPANAAASPPIAAAPPPPTSHLRDIVSPMVGTFYRAASPDAPAFVEVGKEVTEETVVCIIEAMKVMNEIKAEINGVIAEIVAENGKPVQFGQVLYRVR
jgi:acetyl-CoA carboxylase biotin carboxyl carrier protein